MKKYGKGISIFAVCAMGTACMFLTKGETGIGWAILGTLLILEGY
jgi:hypothetical protein